MPGRRFPAQLGPSGYRQIDRVRLALALSDALACQ
jgi:hypothetical protein